MVINIVGILENAQLSGPEVGKSQYSISLDVIA